MITPLVSLAALCSGCASYPPAAHETTPVLKLEPPTGTAQFPEMVTLARYRDVLDEPRVFAACGESVITLAYNGELSRVSGNGKTIWSLQDEWPTHDAETLRGSMIAVSPSMKMFAVSVPTRNGQVTIREVDDGRQVTQKRELDGFVHALAFDPCDQGLLWIVRQVDARRNGVLERWSVAGGELKRIGAVADVDTEFGITLTPIVSKKEMLVAVNGCATMWNCETLKKAREFKREWISPKTAVVPQGTSAVSFFAASTKGWTNLAISARMIIWNAETGQPQYVVDGWRRTVDNAADLRGAVLVAEDLLVAWDTHALRVVNLKNKSMAIDTLSGPSRVVLVPQMTALAMTVRFGRTEGTRLVLVRNSDLDKPHSTQGQR